VNQTREFLWPFKQWPVGLLDAALEWEDVGFFGADFTDYTDFLMYDASGLMIKVNTTGL
jgi:hypothetical protein